MWSAFTVVLLAVAGAAPGAVEASASPASLVAAIVALGASVAAGLLVAAFGVREYSFFVWLAIGMVLIGSPRS